MKYVGSKNRIAKDIIPILLENRTNENCFVDLFMGGCNIVDKVDGFRIANDINPYLVACAEALSNGWLPPKTISEKMYYDVKYRKDAYDKALVGYIGFQLSYGAKWFDAYRKDNIGTRDYSLEAYDHIKKQTSKLKGIKFYNLDYRQVPIPANSIIYCDPPYRFTTAYKSNQAKLDYTVFWQWCRTKSKEGHYVYISEYNHPADFKCIWQKEILKNLADAECRETAIEKLVVYDKDAKVDQVKQEFPSVLAPDSEWE